MSDLTGQAVGLVGLGNMGKGMARNLAKAGARLLVFNRSPAAMALLAAENMKPCASAKALAQAVGPGPIILMVTDTPSVEAALFGEHGVAAGLRPGALVIDMGTTAVLATREFAGRVRAAGGEYVDAPVSGGQIGADAGTLSIMAGGAPQGFARALPLFKAMGKTITHVGDVGAGQVAKAANQAIVGLTIAAVSEALALAEAAGVDPAKVRQALLGGFAASRILEVHGQRMIDHAFAPGGRVRVQRKDVMQALELARSCGLELPNLELNLAQWDAMIGRGDGDLDHSALIRLYRAGASKA
jgi:3-hydroxyisobutyrate dehydrogenase-like beta-hydroxyacid dehydrogenase